MIFKLAFFALLPGLIVAASSTSANKKPHSAAKARTATSQKTTVQRGRKGRVAGRRKLAGPSYPTRPTPERYKEIQQALAEKGYFKGEANGTWGDDSLDALKRFQADHNLPNDGKLSSPALIQLGLGPNHDGNSVFPPPIPGGQTPPSQSVTDVQPPPVTSQK